MTNFTTKNALKPKFTKKKIKNEEQNAAHNNLYIITMSLEQAIEQDDIGVTLDNAELALEEPESTLYKDPAIRNKVRLIILNSLIILCLCCLFVCYYHHNSGSHKSQ